MRCGLKLEEYDCKIIHKDHTHWQGNINAEALSRNPIQNDELVHNVQSKEREDNKKDKKESQKNIWRKRNTSII